MYLISINLSPLNQVLMAITNNILLKQARGALGKQIVIKQYGDKTVLSAYPDMSKRKLSPKQIEANLLMKGANYYAQGIIANPERRDAALLRLKVLENKLYRAIIKDYMTRKGEIDGLS